MDNSTLREKLLQYKNLTEELITAVNNEEPDAIDGLFQKRQYIIDEIDASGYNGDEFRRIAEEFQLLNKSKQLEDAIYKKKDEMRENLRKLKERKVANKSYYNSSNSIKSFFNTRI